MWPFKKVEEYKAPEFTPDEYKLEQTALHPLFDIGPIMTRLPRIRFGYTHEKTTLWNYRTQDEACAFTLSVRETPKHRVRGMLYLLTTPQILELDKSRQNGVSFKRVSIPIQLPAYGNVSPVDNREPFHLQEAWMYKASQDFWKETLLWDKNFYKERSGASFTVGQVIEDGRNLRPVTYYAYTGIRPIPNRKSYIHFHQGLDEQGNST